MEKLVTIKSYLPAISFELDGKYWLACGAQWIEVDHQYSPEELKRAWIREERKITPTPVQKVEVKLYNVKGSKGNIYKVKHRNGSWSCSCPASAFRRWEECKHIKQIKTKSV